MSEYHIGYPVEASVYYVDFNTDYRFWILKISVDWDEDHYIFSAKPTKRQIRKSKKEFVRWSREYLRDFENQYRQTMTDLTGRPH
ncbi:DUF7279 family protein [Xenorhabdus bovienii]|uniref:DUF7279 family protein n=1 Tax=Xenorhabdus bovienii TaxID=40576 RepID=UPI003DA3FD96